MNEPQCVIPELIDKKTQMEEGFLYVRNPMNAHQISRIDLSLEVVD